MKKIAVIGAGTMGNGIAHTFAQNNFCVNLIDISEESLKKVKYYQIDRMIAKEKLVYKKNTILSNISTFTDLKNGVNDCELVIEAATENIELKLNIFSKLDTFCNPRYYTSLKHFIYLNYKLAKSTKRPDKVIGMHFMNPVPIMKLVEVIRGKDTSDTVTDPDNEFSKSISKIPVEVNDAPGFVANRILMPMINEAILTLEENISSVDGIDTVMILGMSHPIGPLFLADFIGLDVCLSILEVMYDGFNDKKYKPANLLVKMVKNNELGVRVVMVL